MYPFPIQTITGGREGIFYMELVAAASLAHQCNDTVFDRWQALPREPYCLAMTISGIIRCCRFFRCVCSGTRAFSYALIAALRNPRTSRARRSAQQVTHQPRCFMRPSLVLKCKAIPWLPVFSRTVVIRNAIIFRERTSFQACMWWR